VISIDEHNVYAAIGIGVYLAEMGETEKAHETFRNVMNVTDIPFMLINDGHIALL
jgi:hypothetical protein